MQYTTEERNKRREQLLRHMEMKRRMMGFAVGICILLGALISYAVLQQDEIQRRYIYPFHYRAMVEEYSHRYQVDEYLVVAMMKTESKFRPEAESRTGATGLLQLMPETAGWIAEQLEDDGYAVEQMKEPEQNIRYGAWYLRSLQEEFQGNEVLMLAAYNAGRGNVLEWMEKNGWDYSFADANAIPYQETREYVKRVLASRNKYQQLYEPQEKQ